MDELIWILILLVIIALVGHGIWVAVRAIVRAIRRAIGSERLQPITIPLCPQCGEVWEVRPNGRGCLVCQWPDPPTPGNSRQTRALVGRLLKRLRHYREVGLLSAEDSDRIAQGLIAEWEQLTEPSADVAKAPSTAKTPRPIAPAPIERNEPVPGPIAPAQPELPLVSETSQEAITPRPDVAARVRAYREAKQVEPASASVAASEEPATTERRSSLGGLLAAFMEERNIRWGELVGGLLIVGCSLALVIGYWDRIAERPILRFALANGVVAAFFGVGRHADRRWGLATTAGGLLGIATLLVPLSVLTVVLARGTDGIGFPLIVGELVVLTGFAVLIGKGSQAIRASTPWATAMGVVVPSAAILAVGWWGRSGLEGMWLLVIGALPLLAHAGATLGGMFAERRTLEFDEASADRLFRTLGLTAFAAAVAIGALLQRSGSTVSVLRQLAVLAPLAGMPSLAAGLMGWRRASSSMVVHRIAGGSIAVAGALVMLGGVALAWPEPAGITVVAAVNAAVLVAIALAFDLPAALALAGASLALAGVVVTLVITGELPWTGGESAEMAAALTSAGSGSALVGIALLFEAVVVGVIRLGRTLEARAIALVSVLAGLLGVGLVTWHGLGVPGDPTGATWSYGALAIGAMLGAVVASRMPSAGGLGRVSEPVALSWIGSGLMLAALVQGFVFRYGEAWGLALPWSSSLLGHATIAALVPTMLGRRWRGTGDFGLIGGALVRSALLTSVAVVVRLVWLLPTAAPIDLAVQLLWLSGVWGVLAWRFVSPGMFWAFQAAMAGSVGFAVASWIEGRPWFADQRSWLVDETTLWLDPRTLQSEGIALALFALGWVGVRIGIRAVAERWAKSDRLVALRRLMEPSWPTFDRLALWSAVGVLVGLAVYGVVPGVAQELSPRIFADFAAFQGGYETIEGRLVPAARAFELPGIAHDAALGLGSWLLLGSVLLTLVLGQWERFRRLDLLGTMLVASMAVPLVAGRWEGDVAVASALRWGGAMALLVLSVPIWARGWLGSVADRIGWRIEPERLGGLGPMAIGLVVAIAALPVMAMASFVASAALWVHPIDSDLSDLWELAGVVFIVLALLGSLSLAIARMWESKEKSARSGVMRVAGGLMIAMGALALVSVSALVVGSVLRGDPILGPSPGSFFGRIGLAGSYAPPILLVALTLVGYAIRERSSEFALAGGLLLSFGATVGLLLSGTVPTVPNDPMLWLRLAQMNAIVGSAYAIGWMGAVEVGRRRWNQELPASGGTALAVQVALPVALIGLVVLVGGFGLLVKPLPMPAREAIADPVGWLAVLLTLGAVFGKAKGAALSFSIDQIAPGALTVGALLAFGTARSDAGNWLTYHAMMIVQTVTAGGLLLIAWNRRGLRAAVPLEGRGKGVTRWTAITTGVIVLFALRAYDSDPQHPLWWTVGGLGASVVLSTALAGWSAGRGFLYVAGLLLNLATTLWWFEDSGAWLRGSVHGFVIINVIALALPVPLWLFIELWAIRPARALEWRRGVVPFHRFAAWSAVLVLAVMVLFHVLGDAGGGWDGPTLGLAWPVTIGVVGIALAAGFWDERSRSEVAGLYLLGLCAAGWFVAGFDLPGSMLAWIGAVILAVYAVIAGAFWSARTGFRRLGDRLSVPRSDEPGDPDAGLGWLIPANITLSAVVVGLAFGVVVTNPDLVPRFSAGKAALATALAVGLLARGERRSIVRATALGFGSAGAVAWGWAWIDPGSATVVLDRGVAVMVALLATATGYGVGLVKLAPQAVHWARAAQRLVAPLLGLAAVALFVVIAGELFAKLQGSAVAISAPGLVAVAVTLLGAVVASLIAAIVPGRDPLGLPESRRTVYVYGAEGLLALLALHLGLTMPWLFTGIFARYWPLIVIGLAFTGVGLGELFRRQGRLVLADPLERTGAVLPVLPLLGAFWLEPTPGEDTVFFVLAGGVYAALALLRSSIGFGAVAALAFNAGLWTVLGRREGFGLLEHPQFWIVPPALCVLVGAYLSRDRLSAAQSASVRHVAAGAVYLSSTADLILNGVAQDPWLPLVLGGLSLLGIFAGIALRVRGFLFLGLAFLGLSIFAMIWYAAVDLRQTWIWAASGIVAGILILAAFALFEKRRRDVMEVVERLKGWEA
ncbi:hypothetical protein [Tautonia rosea]|uniref:hypothetical protein n=1 Tax=Tautonia rosea TaxID=2728037 RepID=UPI001472D3A1|nr:hypothetical protein [Tautonia rosea]